MNFLPAFTGALLLCILSTVAAGNGHGTDTLKIGDPAPTFSLPDLENNYVFLRDFCGTELRKPWVNKTRHVVVLSFFATWCGPCKRELPFLEQLMDEHADDPVRFFLIDVGEEQEKIAEFIKENNVRTPVLSDRFLRTAEKYGARSLPRLAVIDKKGTIIMLQRGFSDGAEFVSKMRELLNTNLSGMKQ